MPFTCADATVNPPPKKKACRAATFASQLARSRENRKEVLELQDTEGHELDSLQKEDAEGDESKPLDLEDTERDESETFDQELVMEEDAFVRLKASIMEDSTIKYYGACQKSRKTAWRD